MKNICFLLLILAFTACKSTYTPVTNDIAKKEDAVAVDVKKKKGISVSNEKFDKLESSQGKYLIYVNKTPNRENRYDLTVKEKVASSINVVFSSFISTEQSEKTFLVKIFLAQKEKSYAWKPVATSFVETSFDLVDGHITYRQEGSVISKYNPKHQKQDKHQAEHLTNKQAIELAVQYYAEHYEKTFVK